MFTAIFSESGFVQLTLKARSSEQLNSFENPEIPFSMLRINIEGSAGLLIYTSKSMFDLFPNNVKYVQKLPMY